MAQTNSQAQNGVNFDFEVKFYLEGHGQSTPKTMGILSKVFYTYGQNLVILAGMGDKLSRGQRMDWDNSIVPFFLQNGRGTKKVSRSWDATVAAQKVFPPLSVKSTCWKWPARSWEILPDLNTANMTMTAAQYSLAHRPSSWYCFLMIIQSKFILKILPFHAL